ncbi:hypothetical protein KIW84_042082 [Lathyrus oleraceus]|uniref:CCAAT-binding factor domain-containing protein n=1 Tax=Pisum sativum TaxID=3888 RepID=A0A9D5AQ58_PEA|nr:hypothetical protein KIW84_042082 [Pisum sativum]
MNTFKAEMFIALILRAMKKDVNIKRVAAFSKRLLQVALQQPPQYACACLFLLSKLFKARPPLWNTVLQNESFDDDELEHFEDVIEETDKEPNGEVAHSDSDSSGSDDDDQPASSEDDDDFDDALEDEGLSLAKSKKNNNKSKSESDSEGQKLQEPTKKPLLPGGYDPTPIHVIQHQFIQMMIKLYPNNINLKCH